MAKPPGTPKSKRAIVAERRTQAIEMDLAGVDTVTIGRSLRYGKWREEPDPDDPETLIAVQVSSDDSLSRMVRQDIDRALKDRRAGLHTKADELVADMTDRLTRLRAAAWGGAMKGNPQLIREARQIDAQLAHLNGLNKPVKHEVDIPSAREELRAALGELLVLAATSDVDLSLSLPGVLEPEGARP